MAIVKKASICILAILVLSLVQTSIATEATDTGNTGDRQFRDDNPALGIDHSRPDPRLVANLNRKLYQAKMEQLGYSPDSIQSNMQVFSFPLTTGFGTLPSKGVVKTLVFLVDFPDYPHYPVQTVADVTGRMNGPGNPADLPTDDVFDYYYRSSYGQLNMKADVYGWYTANRPRSQNVSTTELVREVLDHYDPVINYQEYDSNGDHVVDGFYIIWTGPDGGLNSQWWSRELCLNNDTFKKDTTTFGSFSWEWYTNPWSNSRFDTITACHETGHMLGLPDYFDLDETTGPKGGVGGFDMMDQTLGDHNVFSKYLLGWITPAVMPLDPSRTTKALDPSGESGDALMIMPGVTLDSYAEFFLVQNRYPKTGNDILPSATWTHPGLAVWHVDATLDPITQDFKYDNSRTAHKLLRLMEADGFEEIELGIDWDQDDLYQPGKSFGPNTTPDSFSYRRKDTRITINNIVLNPDRSITADYWISDTAPSIEWSRLLGGNNIEANWHIRQTSDEGYILAGWTESNTSGDVGVRHGRVVNSDVWVVKLNSAGVLQWQKVLGGNSTDNGLDILQTNDGGYLLSAKTYSSSSGDVEENRCGWEGYYSDIWIVKLDSSGTIEWRKIIGGLYDDRITSIQKTNDGGYILAGDTDSAGSGDVGPGYGDTDAWIVKLNSAGTIEWQKTLGGSGYDSARTIRQNSDGTYVMIGSTYSSNSGNVGANHGGKDIWVVILDPDGAIRFSKVLGGTGDETCGDILEIGSGMFILTGSTTSSGSGDVGANHGKQDAWIVKLDVIMNTIKWQKVLGGSEYDGLYYIEETSDDGYVLAGGTESSNSGDVSVTNHGGRDVWVVKLDSAGTMEWQKVLGGSNNEYAMVQITKDNGYIVAGDTYSSNSGEVGVNHGAGDIWVFKLRRGNSTEIQILPGNINPPTDPDEDGIYEDLNGNGRLDFADVVLYFTQMQWIATNEPITAFDLNHNGRIDFADIVALFNEI